MCPPRRVIKRSEAIRAFNRKLTLRLTVMVKVTDTVRSTVSPLRLGFGFGSVPFRHGVHGVPPIDQILCSKMPIRITVVLPRN